MNKKVTPYNHSRLRKKEQVKQMFDTISGSYDGLNRIISLGIDKKWRKKVVAIIKSKRPETILDVATGTGDLAIALAKTTAKKVTGIDIAPKMLDIGQQKIARKQLGEKIELVLADSEHLPFTTHTFDAVTVAFGVRNFENLEKGLTEIYRVLKPKGTFVILETSVPQKTPYRQGYRFYCNSILPFIGRIFSGDRSAYTYLSKSAALFPHGEAFNNILRKIGFIEVTHKPQTFGVATIYVASK